MDYSEFREQYEAQHPASVPQAADFRAARVYPWWLQVVVLIMFVCAALMSGVHTVPTVREGMPDDQMFSDAVKDLIAYGSFAAFELSVFSASYALLRRGSRWVWLTLAVSFLVMVASNLLQVTRAFAVRGDPGTQLVAVIVGIGAPLVALLSGKILVDIHRTNAGQDADAARRFQEARQRHDADVLAAYEKLQKRTGRASSAGQEARPQPDARDHGTGQGYHKRADARAVVWRHLEAHPEDADANVRGLADRLDVGKSTVSDVQRLFRERTLKAINGHGQAEWTDDERTESDTRYSNVRRPVVDGKKVCVKCGRTLTANRFYSAYKWTDGRVQLQGKCKHCVLAEKKLMYLSRKRNRLAAVLSERA